jgi:hypothetical protein
MTTIHQLIALIEQYKQLGIDSQIDYEKFYLYSIITHSTAIEGSTVTEIENQLLFDEGISAKGNYCGADDESGPETGLRGEHQVG